MEWTKVMKKIILALASLFISEQSIAATTAVDTHNHQPLPKTKKVPQKVQAKTGSPHTSAKAPHSPSVPAKKVKASQSASTCPKNCHEAGVMLQHIHDLRVQIEDKQASLNPHYQKKKINPVNINQFKGKCETSCPQITGIQRQVDKYEKDLAALTAKAGNVPAGKKTKGQAKGAQTASTCPKNCHEAGVMLQHIHDLRIQIEDKQAALNPTYQKKKINPVNINQFQGTCDTSCPQITGIQRQVDKYEKDLAALTAKAPTAPAGKTTNGQATAAQAAEKCPKNCFDVGEKLEAAYKLQLEIENEHKRQDPSYQKKSIKPVDIRRFMGTCDSSCPAIIQTEKQVQRFEKELADLKAQKPASAPTKTEIDNGENSSATAAGASQSQRLKGQCTPNCDNEVDLRISIRQKNIELDQLKLAQDPTFKARTYEKEINPSIKIGKQCPVGCKNIIQLENREAQLVAELAKVKTNSKTAAPSSASLKGQCTPNCDNEVDLRTEIRQLNTQMEELKHQQDPSYRMKTFKAIDPSTKIGKQCPVGCNNIKRLEKRKTELETMIATLEKTVSSSAGEEETSMAEPTVTDPMEEANGTEEASPDVADETPLDESMDSPLEEASEEPTLDSEAVATPQKKRSLLHRFTNTVTKHAVKAASTVRDAFLARPKKANNTAAMDEAYGVNTEEQEADTLKDNNPSMHTAIDEESMDNPEVTSEVAIPEEYASEEPIQAETAEQDMENPLSFNPAPQSSVKKKAGNGQATISPIIVPTSSFEDEEASDIASQPITPDSETVAVNSNEPSPSDALTEQDNEQKPASQAIIPPHSSLGASANEEPTLDKDVNDADTSNNQGYETSEDNDFQDDNMGESSVSTEETTEYSNPSYGSLSNTEGGEIFHSDSDDNDNSSALNGKAIGALENIFNGLLSPQQPQAQQPSIQQAPAQNVPVPQKPAALSPDENNSLDSYDTNIPDNDSSLDQSYGQEEGDKSYGANNAYGDSADTTPANDNTALGDDPYGSNAYAAY